MDALARLLSLQPDPTPKTGANGAIIMKSTTPGWYQCLRYELRWSKPLQSHLDDFLDLNAGQLPDTSEPWTLNWELDWSNGSLAAWRWWPASNKAQQHKVAFVVDKACPAAHRLCEFELVAVLTVGAGSTSSHEEVVDELSLPAEAGAGRFAGRVTACNAFACALARARKLLCRSVCKRSWFCCKTMFWRCNSRR